MMDRHLKIRQAMRGDVWLADLGVTVGSEQNGVRPVVVISNNMGNRSGPTVIIAPITSKTKSGHLPTHETVLGCGLAKKSTVLLEQIRMIDKHRLIKYYGTLPNNKMHEIDKAISVALGLCK